MLLGLSPMVTVVTPHLPLLTLENKWVYSLVDKSTHFPTNEQTSKTSYNFTKKLHNIYTYNVLHVLWCCIYASGFVCVQHECSYVYWGVDMCCLYYCVCAFCMCVLCIRMYNICAACIMYYMTYNICVCICKGSLKALEVNVVYDVYWTYLGSTLYITRPP